MSAEAAVLVDVDDKGIASIVLNRPDKNNAMSRELLDGFESAVKRLRADAAVRAVVITGRGKHFCAGADLKDSPLTLAAESGGNVAALRRSLRSLYDPFLSILDIEVPTIAAIRGAAVGGGLGLALACDLRVVAEDARLHANFARLGIHPGMGISFFLPRLIGEQRAAEILFTGRPVAGTEAAQLGLALKAVPESSVETEAHELAARIAASAPEAVRLTKQSLRRALGGDPRAFADGEALAQAETVVMSDAREGIAAWMEKRPPLFTGK